MIEKSSGGSTTIRYKQNKRMKNAYIIPVERDGKTYVVGSSYYTDEENGTNPAAKKIVASQPKPKDAKRKAVRAA